MWCYKVPVSFEIDFVADEYERSIVGGGQPQMLTDTVQVALRGIETTALRDAVHHQVSVGPFQIAFRIFALLQ